MSRSQPDCHEVYEALFELLNETVDPARREELTAHIKACPKCFEVLGIEREVSAIVRRSFRVAAPSHLRERIIIKLSCVSPCVQPTPHGSAAEQPDS